MKKSCLQIESEIGDKKRKNINVLIITIKRGINLNRLDYEMC